MFVGLFFVTTTSVKNTSLSPLSGVNTGNKSPCGNIIAFAFFTSLNKDSLLS